MRIFYRRPLAFSAAMFMTFFIIFFFVPAVVSVISLIVGIGAHVFIIAKKRRFDKLTGAFCALTVASVLFIIYFNSTLDDVKRIEYREYDAVFEITEIEYQMDGAFYFNATLLSLDSRDCDINCHIEADGITGEYSIGDKACATIEVVPFEKNDSGYDEELYYRSKCIWLNAELKESGELEVTGHTEYHVKNVITSVREFCKDIFRKYTDDDTSAFLSALTIGDKSDVSLSLKRDLARLGISHMIAISGMHLSIIMGCLILFTDILTLSRYKSSIFVISMCVVYIMITGALGSVLRAGIMFIIMSLSAIVKRESDSLTSLFVSVALIVLFSPESIFDIGLILSFSSTFGIIVIVGEFMKKKREVQQGIKRYTRLVFISVITTLSALSFSLIPMILYFDSFSIISIITNLIFTPLITVILFIIPVLIIISPIAVMASGLGVILNFTVGLYIKLCTYIARFSDICISLSYPFARLTVTAFLVGILIAVITKKRRVLLIAYVLWFAVYMSGVGIYDHIYSGSGELLFSSYKHNDAMLVRSKGESVYIDLTKGSKNAAQLNFAHLNTNMYSTELDHWVIARYSDSVIGTAAEYLLRERVGFIYLPVPESDRERIIAAEVSHYCEAQGTGLRYYSYDLPLVIKGISITVTEPYSLENTQIKLYSCSVDFGQENAVYYSMGYFDYCEEYIEGDYIFSGGCGTTRKQSNSPKLNCRALILAPDNEIATENIDYEMIYPFDSDNTFCKIRIG